MRVKHRVAAACAALLMLSCAATAADKVDRTRQRLEAVRERIAGVKKEIEQGREQHDSLEQSLADAERKIGEVAGHLHKLGAQIAHRKRAIDKLQAKLAEQRRALSGRLDALGRQIRAAYRTGRQGKLRLLLSQTEPAALGRLLTYYDYYADAQAEAIAAVREHIDALQNTRAELARERDGLQADHERQARLLRTLRDSRAQREQALAKLESRLSDRGRDLQDLKADESELHQLLESLQNKLADIPAKPSGGKSFPQLKGELPAPVDGRTIAAFGQAKSGGHLHWQGVWLAAPEGAPVQAAAAGRVVYVGWMHRYGLIAVLDHGDGYFTVYGHNQSVYAEVGSWVSAGETIAAAGTSGGHKTSGVYFEIRHGRTPQDPADWLHS